MIPQDWSIRYLKNEFGEGDREHLLKALVCLVKKFGMSERPTMTIGNRG